MEIPKDQRERLLEERGITPTLVCDKYGQVLGAVGLHAARRIGNMVLPGMPRRRRERTWW